MSSIRRYFPGAAVLRAFAVTVAATTIGSIAPLPAEALENGHFVTNTATGFAADGYDPVAYFVDRTMRDGKPEFEAMWSGVAWRFVNQGNKAAFLRDPLVYAPAFGGHCPVALARGFPAEGDPRMWAIFDDQLYFFYSQENMLEFKNAPATVVAEARDGWDRIYPF